MRSSFRHVYLSILILFLGTLCLSAQNSGFLRGRVIDELGYPISGVSVFIEGSQIGAQTDLDGYYTIEPLSPGSYNLTASALGYQAQTLFNVLVKSKGTQSYNFTLLEKVEALEGVVLDLQNRISRPKETPLSTQTLSAVELATYPGGNNDVVQVAQT
ncbi:MAG: carboxypeptidase-like regulatory domain-containing protein, partial [Flavobacteriaceae bacterium]